jgi:serine/threonine protein kinase
MSSLSSHSAAPAPLTREAAEALAAQLVSEMIQRWRQGERVYPEHFLLLHPELWAHPEAAADLIYEELCLRQEYGPVVPLEQVLARFPEWAPQLAVLFDCQRVLGPRRPAPQFPQAGDTCGDFLLLAELGRGAHGRVFLASQVSLAERPVVLKVTPLGAYEHLTLARLQHTHIVPLYSVQDDAARGLRALCMPYFGGATLAPLLETVRGRAPGQRTGQDLLDALDKAQSASPLAAPARGPARQALAAASYEEALCWIGACLADALHYAHERGLVHLDVKPSNILLASDGQPMLLDFHLAREPLVPDDQRLAWLGGTSGYMSPEQQQALHAVEEGRPLSGNVDGRSDQYSLALVLYEALAGGLPDVPRVPLCRCHAGVDVGLSDVIERCLAVDPQARYPDMAALAADLRRHLAQRPLAGVRNRSLRERWRKWRRRRPHGLALAGMMLAVVTAAGAVALGILSHFGHRIDGARTDLGDAQHQMASGDWEGASRTLQRGLAAARGVPFQRDLANDLEHQLHRAEEGRAGAKRGEMRRTLHQLAERFRLLFGATQLAPEELRRLEPTCRACWESRARIVAQLSPAGAGALEPQARHDLLDLAIFWADLPQRLADQTGRAEARRHALAILAEAEALFGPSPVLAEEHKVHGAARPHPSTPRQPADAWEHYALGRALLRAGDLQRAAEETERAVRLEPQGLWPNYYQGVCAYRQGRAADAVTAFSVCIGAAPDGAGCYYNRGLAFAALGQTAAAQRDYEQAARLDPTLLLHIVKPISGSRGDSAPASDRFAR